MAQTVRSTDNRDIGSEGYQAEEAATTGPEGGLRTQADDPQGGNRPAGSNMLPRPKRLSGLTSPPELLPEPPSSL